MTEYYLAVFGADGVGRSSLIQQFIQNRYSVSTRQWFTIDGERCLARVTDLANDYPLPLREQVLHISQGYLCIYSVSSRSSYDEVMSLREEIRSKVGEKRSIVIVGNKCDLDEDREVTLTEGENLAALYGCPMFESSAKNSINIEGPFFELIREIRKNQLIENDIQKRRNGTRCSLF